MTEEVSASLNSLVRVSANFQVDGADTDPTTVVLTIRDPQGAISTYTYPATVARDSVGDYHVDILCDVPGTWFSAFRGTGTCVAQIEDDWFISPTGVSA